MSSDRLRENLDAIAEAAGGVSRLRELILQLAVQGKLVEQDPKDDPVSLTLLSEVSGSRRKNLTVEANSEGVFEIPSAWKWARLTQLVERTDYGTSVKAEAPSNAVPVLRMGNIQNGEVLMENLKYVPRDMEGLPELYLNQGDLLFNRTNSYELVGKTGIYRCEPDSVTFASYLIRIRPNKLVDSDFLNHAMNSPYYRLTQIEPEITQQTGQANFNGSKMLSTIIPVAPLAEQKRIVAKVDELMALCDELEQKQEQRHTVRRAAHTSALEALTNAQTPDELAHSWERLQKHWDVLAAHADAVPPLRQAILQLAVQGKLIAQDPKDEQAKFLLSRAQQELQAESPGKNVIYRNVPDRLKQSHYAIPLTWEWAFFGQIAHHRLGKMLDQSKNKGQARKYLRNANVRWFGFDLSDLKEMRVPDGELSEVSLLPGDLVICEGGEPGRTAIWTDASTPMVIQKALHRARPRAGIVNQYLALCLKNGANSGRLAELFTGATIKHLTGQALDEFIIPLPPLAEQNRIVARVDELMTLCDFLEQRAREQETLASQLAHAAVAAVAMG